jgi:hypothetical protein
MLSEINDWLLPAGRQFIHARKRAETERPRTWIAEPIRTATANVSGRSETIRKTFSTRTTAFRDLTKHVRSEQSIT